MDQQYGGGSWMMVPTPSTLGPAQDHHYSQQHQSNQLQYHQLQQQQQQQQQFQQQHHQSLASHFHLLPLVESLAQATESGNRDQHSDALVNELSNHFERCQQLLNSISNTLSTKAITVEGQKHRLEETAQQLNQRRDLISKYRRSVEELINLENSRQS